MKNKTILITGATGFVGSNLLRKLIYSNSDIHIITRKSSNLWRIQDLIHNFTQHNVDLSHNDEIQKLIPSIQPDVVYHCATYGGNSRQDNFSQIIESNFFGTVNLINACKEVGFDLFVNTGSSSEYGVKSSLMTENDVPEPNNNYGISKVASTLYCQSIAINEKLPVITLRLFSPYGNYEDPTRLIPSVVLSCLKDENPKISSTTYVRDFIYIEDVIEAYTNIPIDGSIHGGIVNIGSGKQFSVGEIVNSIIQITKSNVTPIISLPQKWPNEPELWQADISKAASMLNWIPKYDINTGLKTTVKWFENNLQYY